MCESLNAIAYAWHGHGHGHGCIKNQTNEMTRNIIFEEEMIMVFYYHNGYLKMVTM